MNKWLKVNNAFDKQVSYVKTSHIQFLTQRDDWVSIGLSNSFWLIPDTTVEQVIKQIESSEVLNSGNEFLREI